MAARWGISAMSRDIGGDRLHVFDLGPDWSAQVLLGNGRNGLDYVCEAHSIAESYASMFDAMQACERWYATHVFVAFLARMGAGRIALRGQGHVP